MVRGLSRRHLAAGLLAVMLLLAGCSSVPFVGDEQSCGPGDTAIGDVNGNVSSTSFKGELVETTNVSLVIDDGTGTAEVFLLFQEDVKSQVSEGDCLIAKGTASEQKDGEHDVTIIPDELLKEEQR